MTSRAHQQVTVALGMTWRGGGRSHTIGDGVVVREGMREGRKGRAEEVDTGGARRVASRVARWRRWGSWT